jgi:hypothetical protein
MLLLLALSVDNSPDQISVSMIERVRPHASASYDLADVTVK